VVAFYWGALAPDSYTTSVDANTDAATSDSASIAIQGGPFLFSSNYLRRSPTEVSGLTHRMDQSRLTVTR